MSGVTILDLELSVSCHDELEVTVCTQGFAKTILALHKMSLLYDSG